MFLFIQYIHPLTYRLHRFFKIISEMVIFLCNGEMERAGRMLIVNRAPSISSEMFLDFFANRKQGLLVAVCRNELDRIR